MFLLFELFPQLRRRVRSRRDKPLAASAGHGASISTLQLLQYLPLALVATMSVVVMPAVLAAALTPKRDAFSIVLSTGLAVAASVMIARAESAIWTRFPGSRDLTFADLMLWGWLRRCWADRRLAQTQALYEATRGAGLMVSIELLEELSERVAARDAYTHGHNQRVARHAERIAQAMRLTPSEVVKIRTAAMVHDVGKIYTPREILNNPGRLSEHEYAIVKLHAGDGADMLADVGDPEIADIVRHHHEQVDGNGYPGGLTGLDIPLGARIVAVADTFDAITSSRPYRPARTHKRALDIMNSQAGSQLDDVVVAAFLESYSARRSVMWFSLAAALPQRLLLALQAASPGVAAGSGAPAASLLPALGAAGLIALSPGLRHGADEASTAIARSPREQSQAARVHRRSAAGHSGLPATAGTPTATRRVHHSAPRAHIRLGSSEQRRGGGDTSAPLGKHLRGSATEGQERNVPATVVRPDPSESTTPKTSDPPPTNSPGTASSTTPTTPSEPPQPPSLPVGEGSKAPSLPSAPPITVPSLSVTVPGLPGSVPNATESVSKLAN